MLGNDEWENVGWRQLAEQGGSSGVLVIGIALFLAYSFWADGVCGQRKSLALAGSVAVLCAGIRSERRATYRSFARGLIGAGWGVCSMPPCIRHLCGCRRRALLRTRSRAPRCCCWLAAGMVGHSLR